MTIQCEEAELTEAMIKVFDAIERLSKKGVNIMEVNAAFLNLNQFIATSTVADDISVDSSIQSAFGNKS